MGKKERRIHEQESHKHERRVLMVQNTIIVLVVAFVFGFFIFSTVTKMRDNRAESHYVHTSVLGDYMTSLDGNSFDTEDDGSIGADVHEGIVE